MLMQYFDDYARDYQPYKGGAWCYEDGCIYRGLELLHIATGEVRWLDHLRRLVDAQMRPNGQLAGYDPQEYNIDHVKSGKALLYLHEVTDEPSYLKAAGTLIGQLDNHPRTKSGVFWHKKRYPWQIWLDGLYMGAPFLIAYGQRTTCLYMVRDGLEQVVKALEACYVEATGLYAHAMDEAREQRWADPVTGQSAAHWSRALGWLAMALVDIRSLVDAVDFAPLQMRTRKLLADIAALRVQDGMWLQVIDRPDLEGNYQESSASAMFVYALQKAQMLGLYDGDASPLFDVLQSQFVKPKAGGGMEMVDICHVAGLGPFENRYRDGSPEYYLTEPRVPDDSKGVGPLMMAAAANLMIKARRDQSATPS